MLFQNFTMKSLPSSFSKVTKAQTECLGATRSLFWSATSWTIFSRSFLSLGKWGWETVSPTISSSATMDSWSSEISCDECSEERRSEATSQNYEAVIAACLYQDRSYTSEAENRAKFFHSSQLLTSLLSSTPRHCLWTTTSATTWFWASKSSGPISPSNKVSKNFLISWGSSTSPGSPSTKIL